MPTLKKKPLNKKPFKIGDEVKIITGSSKGKIGKVQRVNMKQSTVIIEGINLKKRHSKPRNQGEKGGIFSIEAPLHISNVKILRKN